MDSLPFQCSCRCSKFVITKGFYNLNFSFLYTMHICMTVRKWSKLKSAHICFWKIKKLLLDLKSFQVQNTRRRTRSSRP